MRPVLIVLSYILSLGALAAENPSSDRGSRPLFESMQSLAGKVAGAFLGVSPESLEELSTKIGKKVSEVATEIQKNHQARLKSQRSEKKSAENSATPPDNIKEAKSPEDKASKEALAKIKSQLTPAAGKLLESMEEFLPPSVLLSLIKPDTKLSEIDPKAIESMLKKKLALAPNNPLPPLANNPGRKPRSLLPPRGQSSGSGSSCPPGEFAKEAPPGYGDKQRIDSFGSGDGRGGQPITRTGPSPQGERDYLEPSTFPISRDGLMPAGTNGNPAFEIAGDLGGGRFGRCQATLIEDGTGDPSTCSVASAGHCVLSEQGLRIRRFGTFYGDVIASQVDVIPNGNPGESYARDDTAMIHFSGEVCKTMKSKAPALRLRTTPIQEGETVYAGTRYFGKLHLGQVDSSDKGQTTVNFNFADESGKHQGGVHSGDSGGPLLTVNKDGKFELAGVLSASNDDSQYHQDALGRPTVGGQVGYYASRPEIASYWLRTRPGSQNTELALGYASHEVPTTY